MGYIFTLMGYIHGVMGYFLTSIGLSQI